MNWTTRVNRIAKRQFSDEGKCLWQRQLTAKARIERADKIKVKLMQLDANEQEQYLNELEDAISKKEHATASQGSG